MLKAKISRNDLMGIYVFLLIQVVKMFVFSIVRYMGGRSSPAAFSAGAVSAAGITSVLIIATVFTAIMLGKNINIRAAVTYAFMVELVISMILFAYETRTSYNLTFMSKYISFICFWLLFIASEFIMVHACIAIWNKSDDAGNKNI